MNKYQIISIILCLLIISCKTTTEPVKYDKKIDIITQEVQLIHQLIKSGNFDEAGRLIEKDLKLYPDDIEILNMKAWLFLQKENYEDSERLFIQILEKNKSNPLAYLGLSRLYRITGKKDLAYDNIKKGLGYSIVMTGLWFEKGMLEFEEKNYREALVDFTKSSNLDLKNNDALFFKYLTMLYLGRDYDEIKYIWENIQKTGNMKSNYFSYNADFFYNSKQKEAAYYIVKNGLTAFPEDPFLLNFYSYILYEKFKSENNTADLDESEKNILKCLDKKTEPEFIDTYLCILEAKNDRDKMKSVLEKYLLEFPESEILIGWLKKFKK
jgi:tetratricopeptide (TPR) repeat protein